MGREPEFLFEFLMKGGEVWIDIWELNSEQQLVYLTSFLNWIIYQSFSTASLKEQRGSKAEITKLILLMLHLQWLKADFI